MKTYAFIDSQNLNLGIKSAGWTLDFKKFRLYLKNKYGVDQAYLFIGQVAGQEALYEYLKRAGYQIVFKPTTEYKVNGQVTVKGNVDAELVLHAAAIEYANYDKAIIVSGDGDFACLLEFLVDNNKLTAMFVPTVKYSSLLKPFAEYIVRVDHLRQALEYKVTSIGGRSKP